MTYVFIVFHEIWLVVSIVSIQRNHENVSQEILVDQLGLFVASKVVAESHFQHETQLITSNQAVIHGKRRVCRWLIINISRTICHQKGCPKPNFTLQKLLHCMWTGWLPLHKLQLEHTKRKWKWMWVSPISKSTRTNMLLG